MSCGYFSRRRGESRTPGMVGPERHVEVMLARQAVPRRVDQDPPHDALERLLHEEIVADEIRRHGVLDVLLSGPATVDAARARYSGRPRAAPEAGTSRPRRMICGLRPRRRLRGCRRRSRLADWPAASADKRRGIRDMQRLSRPSSPHPRRGRPRRPTAPAPGTLSVFGHQMRFDLAAGLPARHDEEGAPEIDRARAALVPAGRHQRRLPAGERRHDLGRMGRRRTAISARSTASNGAPGRRRTAASSTRSPGCRTRSAATPIRAASSSRPGTRPISTAWRSRPAIACSSSTWRTAGSPASSTSARPTSSSACRSTSRPMRC